MPSGFLLRMSFSRSCIGFAYFQAYARRSTFIRSVLVSGYLCRPSLLLGLFLLIICGSAIIWLSVYTLLFRRRNPVFSLPACLFPSSSLFFLFDLWISGFLIFRSKHLNITSRLSNPVYANTFLAFFSLHSLSTPSLVLSHYRVLFSTFSHLFSWVFPLSNALCTAIVFFFWLSIYVSTQSQFQSHSHSHSIPTHSFFFSPLKLPCRLFLKFESVLLVRRTQLLVILSRFILFSLRSWTLSFVRSFYFLIWYGFWLVDSWVRLRGFLFL